VTRAWAALPTFRDPPYALVSAGDTSGPATYADPPRGVIIQGVRRQECEVEAEGDAKGWEAHLADLDDDGQDEVVVYCPVCAERKFKS